MAAIKFNSIPDEFNGSIQGQTFYSGSKVSTMRNICRRKKHQSISQKLMSTYLIISDRAWKNLSGLNKTNWQAFAIAFPQRTNKSSISFLSGYALFVKRNQHLLIKNEGTHGLMLSPDFTEVFSDLPETHLFRDKDKLFISLTYPRSNSDLDCYFSLSFPTSRNKLYANKNDRLIRVTSNSTEILDITEDYLAIFGRLPELAESVFFEFFQVGTLNGQYFFQPDSKLIIEPAPPPIFVSNYGIMYNWFCIVNASPFINAPYRIPTVTDFANISTFLGGNSISGGHLKESGFTHWLSPNSGADNSSALSFVGSGARSSSAGTFSQLQISGNLWTSNSVLPTVANVCSLLYNASSFSSNASFAKKGGLGIRIIRDGGSTGETYIGNDGKKYETIQINGQSWVNCNLAETKFQDGSTIPIITSNASWIATVSPAACAYNNDLSNV